MMKYFSSHPLLVFKRRMHFLLPGHSSISCNSATHPFPILNPRIHFCNSAAVPRIHFLQQHQASINCAKFTHPFSPIMHPFSPSGLDIHFLEQCDTLISCTKSTHPFLGSVPRIHVKVCRKGWELFL